MDVMLYMPREPRQRQCTRYDLDTLLAADDGLREEADDIRSTLERGGTFIGGGGASPEFEIRPLRTFQVCVQQYVERVAQIEVEAFSEEEARELAMEPHRRESARWEEGDDAYDAEVYAVLDGTGLEIWSR